ncbi:antA/AntB antirepressor family protein [Wohlfahrtiimonas chitiniclastica]|uniref:antA/AntB antirepressor family protein n=1 Tax=Wohlfahrtiimonas chitiniclastica TaxID=400946 RepID=UPI001BCCCFF3|nr:antA/AntB antirepressor family protein [Wohlfahrtiimonas chitiniclastica]MBS7827374.1 antA/AntB antirepressor family protein [Wohlfahrtiimonas chitiniclastica]
MKNNLIEVFTGEINNQKVNLVDARVLHSFLKSKQDFSTWIKKRIDQYEFREDEDYISLHKIVERENGATSRIEYHLTLDMAKELSMVERTEKGREARRYFIECERQFLNLTQDMCNQECQTRKVTVDQANTIKKAVEDYCKKNNVNWQKFYPALKKDFGIDGSYSDIPAKDFDAVIEYICGDLVEEQFFSKATREQIVFAVALMKHGLLRHFEIDKAYIKIRDELTSIRDRISKVAVAVGEISHGDGAVYDGLSESQLYLMLDPSIYKDAAEVAKKMMTKQLALDL